MTPSARPHRMLLRDGCFQILLIRILTFSVNILFLIRFFLSLNILELNQADQEWVDLKNFYAPQLFWLLCLCDDQLQHVSQ